MSCLLSVVDHYPITNAVTSAVISENNVAHLKLSTPAGFVHNKRHRSLISPDRRFRSTVSVNGRGNDIGDRNCCGGGDDEDLYSMAGIRHDNIPKHVAIILDGSRRWFKAHGKPFSYAPFFESNMLFADLCIKWCVGTATSFIYSLKNLQRGKEANDMLFGNLETFLEENSENFRRKGIRVNVIGERWALPKSLQDKVGRVEEATRDCTKLELMLAVCYSGTRDIVQATRSLCEKVKNGMIEPNAVDEGLFEQELWTKTSRSPHIDLVIRTGGRLRVSDYLMWQLAQAELYFTNIGAPEFNEAEFLKAMRSFQQRERTFGK